MYRGAPLTGPAEGIAVVFQTFALFPWLTVLQNVELGLDALGCAVTKRAAGRMSAIDLIGLDGFQSAYPRELSGGMRQRVGFARAIVDRSDPAADGRAVFGARRADRRDACAPISSISGSSHQLPTKSVLMVTHNIEEAVLMCDRILVLASNPGRIAAEIPVSLPQPRNRLDAAFRAIVDEIYSILTSRMAEAIGAQGQIHGGLAQPLPPVAANRISGLHRDAGGAAL